MCVQYGVGSNLLDRRTRHEANVAGLTILAKRLQQSGKKKAAGKAETTFDCTTGVRLDGRE